MNQYRLYMRIISAILCVTFFLNNSSDSFANNLLRAVRDAEHIKAALSSEDIENYERVNVAIRGMFHGIVEDIGSPIFNII